MIEDEDERRRRDLHEDERRRDLDGDREWGRTERTTERHTTVVDRGGGAGGVIAAILILIVLGVVLFLLFGGGLGGVAEETDINVNINTPEMPDVSVPEPSLPEQPGNSG